MHFVVTPWAQHKPLNGIHISGVHIFRFLIVFISHRKVGPRKNVENAVHVIHDDSVWLTMFVILWAGHMICALTADTFNWDLNIWQTVAKLMPHLLNDSDSSKLTFSMLGPAGSGQNGRDVSFTTFPLVKERWCLFCNLFHYLPHLMNYAVSKYVVKSWPRIYIIAVTFLVGTGFLCNWTYWFYVVCHVSPESYKRQSRLHP
jgi:hypothetical protein